MCAITEDLKQKVWSKATPVNQYNANNYRKDACGAWISFDKYGDRKSIFGWEIDHIFPKSILRDRNVPDKEIDQIDNLRPLNWVNNDSKGTDYPSYHARLTSEDGKNKMCDEEMEVNPDVQATIDRLFGKYLKP